jgi:hypothetical protein
VTACAVPAQAEDATTPRLFFLNIRGQVLSAAPDGSNRLVLVDGLRTSPDGIAVDLVNGHIYYWSNMGAAAKDDGSVMRADLDAYRHHRAARRDVHCAKSASAF